MAQFIQEGFVEDIASTFLDFLLFKLRAIFPTTFWHPTECPSDKPNKSEIEFTHLARISFSWVCDTDSYLILIRKITLGSTISLRLLLI